MIDAERWDGKMPKFTAWHKSFLLNWVSINRWSHSILLIELPKSTSNISFFNVI